jgi:DNA-binding transcriptional LysR family regulator
LETEALYTETMCVVVTPQHPLARRRKPGWADLAPLPWVVPPAWAASRVKLNQMFYKHGLEPPADIIESASFLVTLAFLRERACVGFVALGVASYLAREGLAVRLPLPVPIELPPVGAIWLRSGLRTPAMDRLLNELRALVPGPRRG